jgi:hypothetical protein
MLRSHTNTYLFLAAAQLLRAGQMLEMQATFAEMADCSVVNFYRPIGVALLVGSPYAYNTHAETPQDWAYSHAWQNAVQGTICLIMAG